MGLKYKSRLTPLVESTVSKEGVLAVDTTAKPAVLVSLDLKSAGFYTMDTVVDTKVFAW
ncbi:hypothetical protein BC833DRAFT_603177 [Globomyces pollinis-pini]|nr:hypothetical protein BC833DRAFT_603177 [Globomyces pollinis-pini]KAJ2994374.1 hypothetical protein HDV02_001648 [Globomyces sp. JEL0801]